MTAHTLPEDFAHFLTVHQLSGRESFTLAEMELAYGANWKPAGQRYFSPAFLLANARRLFGCAPNLPNWVVAAELFALGSKSAITICREAGLDPHENGEKS